jgi:ABC-2 type transport system ATP-binding protein
VKPLALEASGISKRYDDRDTLFDVDMVAPAGQLHGLLGPNGAGKTTLLRIVLGLVRRDSGSVHLLGQDLDRASGAIPDGVAGFVDAPAFYPYLSGRQNLGLLSRLDGRGGRFEPGAVSDALEQAGLADHADRTVAGYSAGMRQRLGLAAALLRTPRLLLLDEPTTSLDPAGTRQVRALLGRLVREGTSVVLSSHDMNEVEEICDAVTILHVGKVVFSGTMHELRGQAPASTHVLRTSNDAGALLLASRQDDVQVAPSVEGEGLDVSAEVPALDAYVIALGHAGIAIRRLEQRASSLESLFLQLTADGGSEGFSQGQAQDGAAAARSREPV